MAISPAERPVTIVWPPGPKGPVQAQGQQLHVWATSLDVPPQELQRYAATLSPDESQRASRFHFEQHRDRFIVGRGFLRSALARYLNDEPRSLNFSYGAQGKPALGGIHIGGGLQFNLAHSDQLALLAVTRVGNVGVDVERVRPLQDAEELVARFFSPAENASFKMLSAAEKPTAFFNLWTRKEAWLKATGEGIGSLLAQVEVSFVPGDRARFINIPGSMKMRQPWLLEPLAPAPGFVGAVAIAAEAVSIQCWSWNG